MPNTTISIFRGIQRHISVSVGIGLPPLYLRFFFVCGCGYELRSTNFSIFHFFLINWFLWGIGLLILRRRNLGRGKTEMRVGLFYGSANLEFVLCMYPKMYIVVIGRGSPYNKKYCQTPRYTFFIFVPTYVKSKRRELGIFLCFHGN